MCEVPSVKATLEMTSPLGGETAAWRAVQRAVGFAAVVILAHLPLFLLHLRNLWVMRPHYQFFPLLLGGIGWLLWKRWPRWSVHVPPSWWSSGLLASGIQTSSEEIALALDVAQLKAQQFGLTTQEAFERMVTGARKGSVEMLDELGIVVRAEGAYRRRAEALGVSVDALTDAQRAESLWKAILADGQRELETYGGAVEDYATSFEQAQVAVDNASIALKEVFAPAVAAARRAKLRRLRDVPGLPLALDGHNVLITLECASRGLPLVAADDGFIRDVGEISRAFKVSPATDRVLALMADFLADNQAGPVEVFYDAPLSLSGELARRTREIFASRGLTVQAAAVPVPERRLSGFTGAIATSDTALIDGHDTVVDLAGEIIRRHPAWRLIDLREPGPEIQA